MAEIIRNKNREELVKIAFNIINHTVNRLLDNQDQVVLGIPGGSSVTGIFDLFKEEEILWKNVHIFMVDERVVPLHDPASNFKLAKETFIEYLVNSGDLPIENVHPFTPFPEQPDFGLSTYEEEFKKYGGMFDIVLLSSGEDGHIGSLFPYHNSIQDESEYFIALKNSPKPPKGRITISKKLLLRSQVGLVLFIGEIKRDAYNNFRNKSLSYESCPAKLMESIGESYIVTDLD